MDKQIGPESGDFIGPSVEQGSNNRVATDKINWKSRTFQDSFSNFPGHLLPKNISKSHDFPGLLLG